MLGDKCSFKVQDNPLIHALDEKLQASTLKILWDYLRTEEFIECKVQSESAAQLQAALARPRCATTAGRTLLLGHGNSWFLRPAMLINATSSACVHGNC